MRAEGQNQNLSPPGNLTFGFDTIKDNIIGEWSTGVEAIEGDKKRPSYSDRNPLGQGKERCRNNTLPPQA
ncbi:hypothetical protein [Gibbsiella quercinecans]|uniref:hypothetical protein n=1 Tax=Gibbsiella quercinecans TaxID=929813 RepID=UPI0011C3A1E3|nr:hypothetical protein [Gibbsiella quercinecans]